MTYLQLINRVLIRLREPSALTPTDNDYTTLVGYLVNDAKELVEKAWDWTALRSSVTVTTSNGTSDYSLTGFGVDFKLTDAYDDTSNVRLKLISKELMNSWTALSTAPSGTPTHFCYVGVDTNGDTKVRLYPTPASTLSVKFEATVRGAELSNATDTTVLPTKPIEMYAWAMATRERGETGGTAAQELFGLADRALSDAIALDASKYPAELTWTQV